MRHKYPNHASPSLLLLLAVASSAGCAEEKEPGGICAWVYSDDECPDPRGETGDIDEDPYPCLTEPTNLQSHHTVIQCNGSVNAIIEFKTALGDCADTLNDPALCEEFHSFGTGFDPYEMPGVMGCCDANMEIDEDLYLSFCGADMIEQFCASIPYRLQSYIDKGAFPVGENQAQKLQNYLASNQTVCYNMFNKATDTPGVFGPTSWLVNGGANGAWPLLKNFTITLAGASVTSVSLPDDESDYLSCDDNDFNNTEVFEGAAPPSPGITRFARLTRAGTVALMVGPIVVGGRASGSAALASEARGCEDPWCSFIAVTLNEDSRTWTLEELTLNADGAVSLTNGSATVGVERGSIRLYGVAVGDIQIEEHGEPGRESRGDVVYVLQPGSANLVISGMSAFASDVRWGKNATPITMHETEKGWTIDSFVVEHVDRAGELWTMDIPPTAWE